MSADNDGSMDSGMGKLVLYRLTSMEEAVRTLTDQVSKLVLIEDRQTRMYEAQERAFGLMSDMDKRLKALELSEPITNRTNIWVERAVLVIVGGVAAAVFKLIFSSGG